MTTTTTSTQTPHDNETTVESEWTAARTKLLADYVRIQNHTVQYSNTYNATTEHNGEIIKAAQITGSMAVLVFQSKYGRENTRGTRTVVVNDNGPHYELVADSFAPTVPAPHDIDGLNVPHGAPHGPIRASVMTSPATKATRYVIHETNDITSPVIAVTFTENIARDMLFLYDNSTCFVNGHLLS